MGRFESTVATYGRARQPYSRAFFAEVAEAIGLDGRQRLLDVGTGPGLLAIGFASACRSVTGVDPEAAMIEAAKAAAERADVRLTAFVGRLEDMSEAPEFEVVTIGRAIHWLDPQAALRKLERIVAPRGAVVVCRADSVKDGRNPWLGAFTFAASVFRRDATKARRQVVFRRRPVPPRRKRNGRDDLPPAGRTFRRPDPVALDDVAGDAWTAHRRDEGRNRRGPGGLCDGWPDRRHRRRAGRGVRGLGRRRSSDGRSRFAGRRPLDASSRRTAASAASGAPIEEA